MANGKQFRNGFAHSRLDVYQVASTFFRSCWRFADQIGSRDTFLRSQFLRAALSIKLNIAEGAAEYRNAEKVRFYRMARRSAGECSAILDDLPDTIGIHPDELDIFYRELTRISRMLLELIRSVEKRPKNRSPRN